MHFWCRKEMTTGLKLLAVLKRKKNKLKRQKGFENFSTKNLFSKIGIESCFQKERNFKTYFLQKSFKNTKKDLLNR